MNKTILLAISFSSVALFAGCSETVKDDYKTVPEWVATDMSTYAHAYKLCRDDARLGQTPNCMNVVNARGIKMNASSKEDKALFWSILRSK